MIKPTIPQDETLRVEALKNYEILDTLPEEEYDALTKIAAQICGTPIALVSLIDPERQWFKSHYGLDTTETPRDLAFCAHAINTPNELFIVPDATKDDRFFDNPLTTNNPNVIFYAGAPLNTSEGYSLGTLCVIDTKPRENLTDIQKESLKALANQVISQFELRKRNKLLQELNDEIMLKNEQLNQFAHRLTHDLKVPIRGVNTLISFIKTDYKDLIKNTEVEGWIDLIYSRNEYMDFLINGILEYTKVSRDQFLLEDFNIQTTIQYILENGVLDIPIEVDYISCDRTVHHSKIGFIQIVQNLISNTIKHRNKDRSKVWFTTKVSEDCFSFIYEDDGPGIEEQYWEKAFELFETLNASHSKNSGIGLATIKAIIARLGGTIYLKDRPNKESGVCFYFELPRNKKD